MKAVRIAIIKIVVSVLYGKFVSHVTTSASPPNANIFTAFHAVFFQSYPFFDVRITLSKSDSYTSRTGIVMYFYATIVASYISLSRWVIT